MAALILFRSILISVPVEGFFTRGILLRVPVGGCLAFGILLGVRDRG